MASMKFYPSNLRQEVRASLQMTRRSKALNKPQFQKTWDDKRLFCSSLSMIGSAAKAGKYSGRALKTQKLL